MMTEAEECGPVVGVAGQGVVPPCAAGAVEGVCQVEGEVSALGMVAAVETVHEGWIP